MGYASSWIYIGAPRPKTLEIIRSVETDSRGYYTGIYGCLDGQNLDSAVAIRFLEKQEYNFFYRSGGGVTSQSSRKEEYQELLDKIYVPALRIHSRGRRTGIPASVPPSSY